MSKYLWVTWITRCNKKYGNLSEKQILNNSILHLQEIFIVEIV